MDTKIKIVIIGNIPNGKILAKNILSQSDTKGAEGDDPNDRRCATCKYEDDFYSSYCDKCDKNYCMWETDKPLTGGMSEDEHVLIHKLKDGFNKIMALKDEYGIDKVTDQVSITLNYETARKILDNVSALKSLHLPSEGEIATMAKEVIPEDLYNDASGYPSIEDRNYEKRKLWIAGAKAILNLIKGG